MAKFLQTTVPPPRSEPAATIRIVESSSAQRREHVLPLTARTTVGDVLATLGLAATHRLLNGCAFPPLRRTQRLLGVGHEHLEFDAVLAAACRETRRLLRDLTAMLRPLSAGSCRHPAAGDVRRRR